ncbi:MAG TPA: bifunctional phosphopantothenoylcysteine decarboxylase/phosphopantothenate--cysteine ligase CoaBC [Methylophaga aminisulfidivorans]|uniref:Coenzyme A biosynthesis bifunctional protein CoaBC n=2 Tax=root TaxID=1 RepID=A0A7C1VQB2_9GAMM|nr:bifunctional phosphopantothenoylcysteine decarboxylase/phosphopantothenate--cysteine ligase CoaBC [Methylophaga aminisulfidivorans]
MNDSQSLMNKNIVLGVTGSIAAYKSAELTRLLIQAGANVRVMMTSAATQFITPLTLQTLSGHPVSLSLLDADEESAMGHIALARWADHILIAPATADTLSRLAFGRADDVLTAVCLATEAPIALAPAMNNKMWSNQATQANLMLLQQRGMKTIGPDSGQQACGEVGEGRFTEPQQIVNELVALMTIGPLVNQHVVITAGPTYEAIDPVRFIGNRSSGKMGFALAIAAMRSGAKVTLVAGPVNLDTPQGIKRIDVESAEQMASAVTEAMDSCSIFIACAAVADFTPMNPQTGKMKKNVDKGMILELKPTKDIVSMVAADKKNRPFVVGFAAETQHLADYAKDKLKRKQLDMIAANLVGENKGFAVDDNALEVFWSDGHKRLPLMPKSQLAEQLMTLITERFYAKNTI